MSELTPDAKSIIIMATRKAADKFSLATKNSGFGPGDQGDAFFAPFLSGGGVGFGGAGTIRR